MEFLTKTEEDNSEDENSDDGLHIVIESPRPKRKLKLELNESDKEIIACVEKDLEENLEEKAARANLSTNHVKHILKQVISNEDVIAFVKRAENPEENDENAPIFEPKYTRAKTKELLSTAQVQPTILPWVKPPKQKSEVHVLISDELQEDSSGDEYVPETEKTQTSINEEDLDTSFKEVEEANIALRTRSKLSLSHKPLEDIESAFMPPDITTDMYDMDCDDDVWKEFLKTFTKPLDEVTKAEDEEQDPEYNILADEETEEEDREELRADRAVTVSRKELNALMAELFEYADIYESNQRQEKSPVEESNTIVKSPVVEKGKESQSDIITKYQAEILGQQLRQHVQMLTQNFLLTYEHPEFDFMAPQFKEFLVELKKKSEDKIKSMYHILNLPGALKIVESWENLFATNSKATENVKSHFERVVVECVQHRKSGIDYIPTFPPLVMDIISKSNVFMYSTLLPRIPFKPINPLSKYSFTDSEHKLIALFLEQGIPNLKQDPYHMKNSKIIMRHVYYYIQKFLMSHIKLERIEKEIVFKKRSCANDNAIKYFFKNRKVPPCVHYVFPIDPNYIPAPCDMPAEQLPALWRAHIYPEKKENVPNNNNVIYISPINVQLNNNELPVTSVCIGSSPYECVEVKPLKNYSRRRGVNLAKYTDIIKARTRGIAKCLFKNSHCKVDIMLPDMPSLGATPKKNNVIIEQDSMPLKDSPPLKDVPKNSSEMLANVVGQELSFQNILQQNKAGPSNEIRTNFQDIELNNQIIFSNVNSAEKDNPDDINELMIASSMVKTTKKEPSGAEKKRAKLRKTFMSNLQMATPESRKDDALREEKFAEAYHKKLKEILSEEDFRNLMQILLDFEEKNHTNFLNFFNQVQAILYPKYEELSEEFLLFLSMKQACEIRQLTPYLKMSDMALLMKKTQMFFKDQPAQWKKFLKCMTDLANDSTTDTEAVKNLLLPYLKDNSVLTEWYMQYFPPEKPSKILINGPCEVVDVRKELLRQPDEEIYETIKVPDTEDPYGGVNCICDCHHSNDNGSDNRSQHCNHCGLKFIQGKMYVTKGKALRRANFSFLTNPDADHSKRLMSAAQKAKLDASFSKPGNSPQKESQVADEVRHSNESEDECDGNKKKKRKSKVKHRDKSSVNKNIPRAPKEKRREKQPKKEKSLKRTVKKTPKKKLSVKKQDEVKPGATPGQQKRLLEETVETECSEQAEFVELKTTSDCGESESEFFESSQDITNTDDDTGDDSVSSNASPVQKVKRTSTWTREEDKIILQTLQQRINSEETFQHIAQLLENRSVVEIKNRFKKLMLLLQELVPNSV